MSASNIVAISREVRLHGKHIILPIVLAAGAFATIGFISYHAIKTADQSNERMYDLIANHLEKER